MNKLVRKSLIFSILKILNLLKSGLVCSKYYLNIIKLSIFLCLLVFVTAFYMVSKCRAHCDLPCPFQVLLNVNDK